MFEAKGIKIYGESSHLIGWMILYRYYVHCLEGYNGHRRQKSPAFNSLQFQAMNIFSASCRHQATPNCERGHGLIPQGTASFQCCLPQQSPCLHYTHTAFFPPYSLFPSSLPFSFYKGCVGTEIDVLKWPLHIYIIFFFWLAGSLLWLVASLVVLRGLQSVGSVVAA